MQRDISNKSLQVDALDGLRGFAALMVVFSHTSDAASYFLPGLDTRGVGKSGVFLFFLLSSFLLATAMLKKSEKTFTVAGISHYWERRFLRIYPLYSLYLLAGLISTFLIASLLGKENLGFPFSLTIEQFFGHIFLLEGKGLTWSIAVEFKFYFALPFLAFLTYYLNKRAGFWSAAIFLVGLIILSQFFSPQVETLRNDVRLLPYMPIFLIGILVALIQCEIDAMKNSQHIQRALLVLGPIGVIGIVLMMPSVTSIMGEYIETTYFDKWHIQYAILWSFILLSCINIQGPIKSLFMSKTLRFYGALSFSVYLFHPVFIVASKYLQFGSYLAAWFVLAGTTITSFISFKVLEEPVSKMKFQFLRK
jgi:peptidoglycan/LPS O-acetylase OafA/YrhL